MLVAGILRAEAQGLARQACRGRGERERIREGVMTIPRRRFSAASASAAARSRQCRSPAWRRAYPSRPITLVVFVPPGGAPDIVARLIGQPLSQRLGQPVVIENRPGGGGNLALQAVARAPADGHTLLLIATPHAVNVTLYEKLDINVIRDIVPVASIDNDAFVDGGQSFAAGQNGCRIRRPREGQSRQDQHGVERQRQPQSSGRRAVQDDDRHRNGSRAVSRHAGGDHRADDRRRARRIRRPAVVAVARQRRQGARARGDDRQAREGAAGRSRRRRHGAGLRGDRLARHRRAQGHPCRRRSTGSARKSTRCSPIPRP